MTIASNPLLRLVCVVLLSAYAFCQQPEPVPTIQAAEFHYRTLKVTGSSYTFALGVNNYGDIVGQSANGAFLYSAGKFQNVPCGYSAHGINDNGVIVGLGIATQQNYSQVGTIYQNGTCTTVLRPLWAETSIDAINNQGLSIGEGYNGPRTGGHGFTYINGYVGGVWDLTIPGGVNNSGLITGTECNHVKNICFGAVWPNQLNVGWHSHEVVKYPDATYTYLGGVNDNGDVVGVWGEADGSQGNFVYNINTKVFTVFRVGYKVVSQPMGINNAGEIVGSYSDGTSTYGFYGYLAP